MLDLIRFLFNAEQQILNIKQMFNPDATQTSILPQGAIMKRLMDLLQRSLSKEDYDYLVSHVVHGAPGHLQFLNSESIVPVVQLLNEEYRKFLRGETK